MQSELKSLSKIFSEVIFRIPDYQRGYSWEEKHLKDFWSDLEQLEDSKSHYTGVLTLEPVNESDYLKWEDDLWIIKSKRYSPMYVVDGQQRLTTAVILLQVIIEAISDDGELINYTEKEEIRRKYIYETKDKGISKSYIFGYEKDNPSYEFLKQEIFGDESIQHSFLEETIYTKNLAFAKSYFAGRVSELSKEELERLYTKLTQHLQFNMLYIEKDLDVFVTFETMNNRGKPLSHLELLKNRLIYLSTKFDADKSESDLLRKAINESWKSVYHYLGMMKGKRFNDDDFLQTHYIFYFAKDASKDVEAFDSFRSALGYRHDYQDILLDRIFSPKRLKDEKNPLSIKDVFDYSQSMKTIVRVYYQTANPSSACWQEAELPIVNCITRLEHGGVFTLAMIALFKIKPGKSRENFLYALERMGFLSKINAYYFGQIDFLELYAKLLSRPESVDDFTKFLGDLSDRFVKSKEFVDGIQNVGKGASGGYYRWRALRYFMFEYEQDLKYASKTSRELLRWADSNNEKPEDHRTIEHIYPQKAIDGYWKGQFDNYSVKERNVLRNSLGNLLPASKGKNSSLSNKSFEKKKGSESNQVGYRYGCLSEIQVAMRDDWDAKEILRRGIYLLDFMERRWKLKIGDAAKKVEILGLKFVVEREELKASQVAFGPLSIPEAEIEKSNVGNEI